MVVDWKIWAFENIRNVHELKRKAIQNKLIWYDGSWFNSTQIMNYDQKQKLKILERKFLEKDVYNDDVTISKETLIYFSKWVILYELLIGFVFLGTAAYLIVDETADYFIIIIILLGCYFVYLGIIKLINNKPQLILNIKGIQFAKGNLYEWKTIQNEIVEQRSNGKYTKTYLVFLYDDESIENQVDDFGISSEKLEKLLQVYRVRFEKYLS